MTISEETVDGVKIIYVSGKVDSVTATDLQNYMLRAYTTNNDIVMDFANVDYVSSAGLRVFLIAQKTATSKGGTFRLRNINESVMTIIKTVGMETILNIE